MNYVLYITDGCKSCINAVRYIETNALPVVVINLSSPKQTRPDSVVIVPALFAEKRLLAYGPDIQRMFKQINSVRPVDMSQD